MALYGMQYVSGRKLCFDSSSGHPSQDLCGSNLDNPCCGIIILFAEELVLCLNPSDGEGKLVPKDYQHILEAFESRERTPVIR